MQTLGKDLEMHWKEIKHDFFTECAKRTNQRYNRRDGKRSTNKIKYYDNLSFLLPQKKLKVANRDDRDSEETNASSSSYTSSGSDDDDSDFKNHYDGSSDDDQPESP